MRLLAIILLLLNGLSALYGGYMLLVDPTGFSLGLSVEWLKNTPFNDYNLPGLFLFCVHGIGNLMILVLVFAGMERYYYMVQIAGLTLIGWILVQMAMIHQFSWLQVTCLVIGTGMAISGRYLSKQVVGQ